MTPWCLTPATDAVSLLPEDLLSEIITAHTKEYFSRKNYLIAFKFFYTEN
jgi:hypothetical protein